MASPNLVMDPSDVARKVVESNLRVVWRGSQRVNLSVCMLCDCKMWWNCGWRWDNKAILFKVFVHCVVFTILKFNIPAQVILQVYFISRFPFNKILRRV
jgi:hypothetical protein